MTTSIAETNAQLIGSIIIQVGTTAKVMGELLEHDQITREEREGLKDELVASIEAAAVGLDHSRRGTGELLTRSFAGTLRRGGSADAGGMGG